MQWQTSAMMQGAASLSKELIQRYNTKYWWLYVERNSTYMHNLYKDVQVKEQCLLIMHLNKCISMQQIDTHTSTCYKFASIIGTLFHQFERKESSLFRNLPHLFPTLDKSNERRYQIQIQGEQAPLPKPGHFLISSKSRWMLAASSPEESSTYKKVITHISIPRQRRKPFQEYWCSAWSKAMKTSGENTLSKRKFRNKCSHILKAKIEHTIRSPGSCSFLHIDQG